MRNRALTDMTNIDKDHSKESSPAAAPSQARKLTRQVLGEPNKNNFGLRRGGNKQSLSLSRVSIKRQGLEAVRETDGFILIDNRPTIHTPWLLNYMT